MGGKDAVKIKDDVAKSVGRQLSKGSLGEGVGSLVNEQGVDRAERHGENDRCSVF